MSRQLRCDHCGRAEIEEMAAYRFVTLKERAEGEVHLCGWGCVAAYGRDRYGPQELPARQPNEWDRSVRGPRTAGNGSCLDSRSEPAY